MSKQDRQGARSLAELMSRYNFGKSFAEMFGLVQNAQSAADRAQAAADRAQNAVDNIDHEAVFNLLTNNGAAQGIYRGEDGEVYINASYIKSGALLADLIKSGTLTSLDGTVKVDLSNNCVTVDGKRNGYKTQVVISANGMKIYGENTEGEMEEVIDFMGGVGGLPSGIVNPSWRENIGLLIAAASGVLTLGTSEATTEILGSSVSIDSPTEDVSILGKQVSWKDNGDGTYTLIGQ